MSKKNKNKGAGEPKDLAMSANTPEVGYQGYGNVNATEQPAEPAKVYEPTEEQKAALADAISKGDYKTIAKISKEIATEQSKLDKQKGEAKKKEDEEKKAALAAATTAIKERIVALVQSAMDTNSSDYVQGMEKADVVSFKWDLKEPLNTIECRLFKGSVAAKTGGTHTVGGGATKKYSISTEELLKKFGENIMVEETGETYQAAHDSTTDGNKRYQIRVKLLKLEGLIK